MKQKSNLTILLSAVIMMFSLICGTALAKQPAPPPPPPGPVCGGLTGTWHGEQAGDMVWLALHTSDSLDPFKGEMVMNWIDTKFLGQILGPDYSLTPGHGVWQFNSESNYFNYTWYAFGTFVDVTETLQTMTLRVSGVAAFEQGEGDTVDCNRVNIYYQVDIYGPAVPVGGLDPLYLPIPYSENGYAYQFRVPLVVTPVPLPE